MSSEASYPWLVADIGGTNARFGLVRDGTGVVSDVHKLKAADHASPQAAALAYLETLGGQAGSTCVQRAALALATPVHTDPVKLTNSDWIVSRAEIAAALRLERVLLLNDFEALALSLPVLRVGADVRLFGAAQPDPALPMAVLGPGTGLGVAGCIPNGHGWTAVATEGGHATVAAADAFEDALIGLVRREQPHVSAEDLLSGTGLPALHRAVCALRGAAVETLMPHEITRRALDGGDAVASAALDTFCAMLGTFAGNVALTLGARGGLYVAGGIAQHLGDHFVASRFRERFEAKGRFRTYMSGIATGLIIAPDAALAGAATALMQST
jgi:glucokinase